MARNRELEAILLVRYELENCEPNQKTERRAKLDELIEAALAKRWTREISRRTLMEIIAAPYQQFKLAKEKEQRRRLSRLH